MYQYGLNLSGEFLIIVSFFNTSRAKLLIFLRRRFNYLFATALNASSRSKIISSICSVPIESLIVFGLMPCSASSSSLSCECVVVAGWIARDLTSATFARSENTLRLSMNFCASSDVPLISNVKIEPAPFGKYLS